MSLSKQVVIDQVTVDENGFVLYREATRVIENGEVISTSFHRNSLTPTQDLTDHPANVAAIATAAWSPEIVSKYQAMIAV